MGFGSIAMRRLFFGLTILLLLAAGSGGASRTAEPTKRSPTTGHDEYAAALAFNRQTLVTAYQQTGRRNAKWDAAAVQFLEVAARHFAATGRPAFYVPADAPTRQAALDRGDAALRAGCDDPLVVYCCAALVQDTGMERDALPLLRRAHEGLAAPNQPSHWRYDAAHRLAKSSPDEPEAASAAAAAALARARMLCGRLDDTARRLLLATAWRDAEDAGRAAQHALVETLDKQPDADPWARDVAAGQYHLDLAWDSRGTGPASALPEENWKSYYQHLAAARERLTRAWALAPHLPEAPAAMIGVAMGAGARFGEQPQAWFDRAMAAQVDYLPAYQRMYRALLPRWGGSYDRVVEAGRACLKGGRFDTLAPWQFVEALRVVADDADLPWSTILRRPDGIYDGVEEVARRYAAAQAGTGRADWYASFRAAAAWQAGRPAAARKLLDELGPRAEPSAFVSLGAEDGVEAIGQIYATTGPYARAVLDADQAAQRGQPAAALEAYRAVAGRLAADDPAAAFVTARVVELDRQVRFESGQWVNIQPDPALDGWQAVEGNWWVDANGTLVGGPDERSPYKTILWSAGRFRGKSFEIAGRIEFADLPPGKPGGNAGVVISAAATRKRGFVLLDTDRKAALYWFGSKPPQYPVSIEAANDFVIRCKDGYVTMEVGGDALPQPFLVPDRFLDDVQIGVGGVGAAPVRFSRLKVRQLPAPVPPQAALSAGADGR